MLRRRVRLFCIMSKTLLFFALLITTTLRAGLVEVWTTHEGYLRYMMPSRAEEAPLSDYSLPSGHYQFDIAAVDNYAGETLYVAVCDSPNYGASAWETFEGTAQAGMVLGVPVITPPTGLEPTYEQRAEALFQRLVVWLQRCFGLLLFNVVSKHLQFHRV